MKNNYSKETHKDTPPELLPKRDAINELMAQIPYSEFPELVEQILIENLLHIRGDITDGAGRREVDNIATFPKVPIVARYHHPSNFFYLRNFSLFHNCIFFPQSVNFY